MDKILPFLALALLTSASACAPTDKWQKAGADPDVAQRDASECRQTAQVATFRNFNQPMPLPWAGSEAWTPYLQIRQDNPNMWFQAPYTGESPAAYDSRVNAWCMRHRGYQKVPVMQQPQANMAEAQRG